MSWRSAPRPSMTFLLACERDLVRRLEGGWELIGNRYRRGPFVEHEREDVVAFALERGTIIVVDSKPDRYELVTLEPL